MNNQELANKIDWEGGFYGALQYGIDPRYIQDKEMRELWVELQARFGMCEAIVEKIRNLLPEPGDDF